ncbi:uncharacterized protein F5Z01DRAFT_678594 [Emericellopsis atlantica]|uniref:Uncharacterized protein n=1 Tax=Emericellopsis atlantica TaxID=2614577 RepID=A0A9P7ZCN4_9HYPO|nr:uncharacterized protein F5Z01DRAFT_678594 [Emericellopsis atlantica]KAG9249535.1 hypothetical protein F5Z01DRAFT_678594 [Emericellopsis atlantica]
MAIMGFLVFFASMASLQANASPLLQKRDQDPGTACSPEGQWSCHPDTFQRCASGQWSVVMDLAEGTKCSPDGLSDEMSIEHDGSVNGQGGQDTNAGTPQSSGARCKGAIGLALAVLGMVAAWES